MQPVILRNIPCVLPTRRRLPKPARFGEKMQFTFTANMSNSECVPAAADEATVRGWIAEAIAEVCPDGPDKKLMGKVMGALMKKHRGEFDGKEANKWVGEMLTP